MATRASSQSNAYRPERLFLVGLWQHQGDGSYVPVPLAPQRDKVTVSQAARISGRGVHIIDALCDDGTLEYEWLNKAGRGGKRVVVVESLQRWMQKLKPGGGE